MLFTFFVIGIVSVFFRKLNLIFAYAYTRIPNHTEIFFEFDKMMPDTIRAGGNSIYNRLGVAYVLDLTKNIWRSTNTKLPTAFYFDFTMFNTK